MNSEKQILLVGNPNVGKSTIFNSLCNKNQKTGNYAGVTVASQLGQYVYKGEQVSVVDLPGAYSIYPSSEDEAILSKYIIVQQADYHGIVYILDAMNLRRSMLLFHQLKDLGVPILLVVNQLDEAERRGVGIDFKKLEAQLGIKIIPTNAKAKIGLEDIKVAIQQNLFSVSKTISFSIPTDMSGVVAKITSVGEEKNQYKIWTLLASEIYLGKINSINDYINETEKRCIVPKRLQTQETIRRYQLIDQVLSSVLTRTKTYKELLTEKIDRLLVHPFWGYVVFCVVLLLIFQLVFYMAEYPMDWIETLFVWLSDITKNSLPEGPLNSLISDGIIPGLGGIVIFAPQIGVLLYFLYLLEDSGYMSRIVYLTDRYLKPFGLNGKSIVPLVTGVACAIPAIMSTRNIENVKERLITILVTPFMTCSARLPVYSIIIAIVIPKGNYFVFENRAVALFCMYVLGVFTALVSAYVLKKNIKQNFKSYLVMDLPPYKIPMFMYDFKLTLSKVWDFITGAGKVILSVSIILWVLSYIGPKQKDGEILASNVELKDSYLALLGQGIEPLVKPLGYDWKMGVSIISSFAAREVFVGTISTLYSLDKEAPEQKIVDKMRNDKYADGSPVFSLATGLSVMVYYAFALQCISTIAVVYRETKSKKWTILQLFGMSGLAYISAFIIFQFFK